MKLQEKKVPDAPGWWARKSGRRVKWFRVEEIDVNGVTQLEIYIPDLENFVPLADFCKPLTKWAGPVTVPWSDLD